MSRGELKRAITAALQGRELFWSGIRGDDAESLSDLPQFAGAFSIIAAYDRRPLKYSLAYEDVSKHRTDLETWDIDDHLDDAPTKQFRSALLRAMSAPCALVPYRPSAFQSALAFARQDRCLYLGLFGAHQNAFEHKPWVETAVRGLGVDAIEWRYIADEDQLDAERLLADGPIMLRRSRTSGGEGFALVEQPDHLTESWLWNRESFVSVARYYADGVPLNVGATVWDDGVTVHFPSVQLIGLPSCTSRPFGYCGNDFSAVRNLDSQLLVRIEQATRTIGQWLHRYGYRGTFGVDYLYFEDRLLFTEVNARFQGSTRASARLSVLLDEPCLPLEHVAAHLGISAPAQRPLTERVNDCPSLSQVVVHWTGRSPATVDVDDLRERICGVDSTARMDARPPSDVVIDPGATVARFALERSVTQTGFDLDTALDDAIRPFMAQSAGMRDGSP